MKTWHLEMLLVAIILALVALLGAITAPCFLAPTVRALSDVAVVVAYAGSAVMASVSMSLCTGLTRDRYSLRSLMTAHLFAVATVGVLLRSWMRDSFALIEVAIQCALGVALLWSLKRDLRACSAAPKESGAAASSPPEGRDGER